MKLSTKQKEVIKLMREGWLLWKDYGKFGYKHWLTKQGTDKMIMTDGRAVSGLQIRQIVIRNPYQMFKLTRLGKTISLEPDNSVS